MLNATHDPALRSWVASANAPDCDFPIQNLPLGIFSHDGSAPHGGIAIGDQILCLKDAQRAGVFTGLADAAAQAACEPTLNRLMAMGNAPASALRAQVSALLSAASPARPELLVPMSKATMHAPTAPGAFTDFLTSIHHMWRGILSRDPNGQLPPAFKHLPIAYNSRASSLVASPHPFVRPHGVRQNADGSVVFAPTVSQDFELELGFFVGAGNRLGQPVNIEAAEDHIFGLCLLNDWSTRDVQRFESTPLGPFLGKAAMTSVSPWVVTLEALAPFRIPGPVRPEGDPAPLPHFVGKRDQAAGGLDLGMEVLFLTPKMRAEGAAPARIVNTNFQHMYWTLGQMLTHHASNGCNLRPGDVMASGTCSGPTDDSRACMSEITRGREPITLPNGETRLWLQDGDEVIFRARANKAGAASLGFGECRGVVLPAVEWPSA